MTVAGALAGRLSAGRLSAGRHWWRIRPGRIRGLSAGTLVLVIAGTLLGSVFGLGAMGQAPAVFDGSAWLWSRSVGEVARLNGGSGNVDLRQPLVDSRGHRIRVTQDDNFLLLHDLETGRVTSVDLARMGFSGSLALDPENDVVVLLSGSNATVVDRTRGLVRSLDAATLQVRGEPLQLPAPLVGGAYDASGALWLGLPGQGTVVAVSGSGPDLAVSRTVPVAAPGRDLALSVLDDGVLAIDRSGDTMVAVTGEQPRPVKSPITLAGATVPERTVGRLAVVTVPASRAAVAIEDVNAGGPVHKVSLPANAKTAVPFANRIYVPDEAAGLVRIFDLDGNALTPIKVPRSSGPLELLVREQRLFINALDAPTAIVIDGKGKSSVVDKFGPGAAVPDPTADVPKPPASTPPRTNPPAAKPPVTPSTPKPPPAEKPGRPGVPVPVTVLAGDGQVRVSWGRSALTGGAPVDRYVVTFDGGRVTIDGDTLSTVVTGLRNGTAYRFRVVAENEYGTSPPALSEPVTPVSATAPATPAAPTATVAAGRVTVSWTAVDGAQDYVVQPLRDGATGGNPPQTVTGLSTEFEGLTPGGRYTFTVVARNGSASAASAPSNEVIPFTRPGAPRNLVARQANATSYQITWDAATPNGRAVQNYVVRDGDGKELREVSGTTETLTVTSTTALTEVSVSAVNEAGEGPAATARVTELAPLSVEITEVELGDDDVIVHFKVTNPRGGSVTCLTEVGPSKKPGCGNEVEVTGLQQLTRYTVEVTVTSSEESDSDSQTVTTLRSGVEANVHCHDNAFCTADGGVPVFDSTNWDPDSAVSRHKDDDEIWVLCKQTSDNVEGLSLGGLRNSSWWVNKAGGHWLPYAFVNMHNGNDINDVPNC